MLTVAIELSKALVANQGKDAITLLCSRERPTSLGGLECEAVLSPYRHEVALKMRWLPNVEPQLGCDAILYPYWPSPPFRHADAPPAAIFVHDLAFRLRPKEVPWQQRAYLGTLLGPALKQAAAVLVPSESTRRDLLDLYKVAGLESKVEVIGEGVPQPVPAGPQGWSVWGRASRTRSPPARCPKACSPDSSWPSAPSSRARTIPASSRRSGRCAADRCPSSSTEGPGGRSSGLRAARAGRTGTRCSASRLSQVSAIWGMWTSRR